MNVREGMNGWPAEECVAGMSMCQSLEGKLPPWDLPEDQKVELVTS